MRFKLLSMAALLLIAANANAEKPTFKFSAFGTLGVAYSSEDEADYTGTQYQPDGVGYTRDVDLGVDSKVGAQIDIGFLPQLSFAAQALVEKEYKGDYDIGLALGFLKYAPGAGISLRAGRLPYPAYLVSDYRKIGYSQPWIRPPSEVYYRSARYIDGGDVTWRKSFGSVVVRLQGMAGSTNEKLALGEFDSKDEIAGNITVEIDSLSLRASYIHVDDFTLTAAQIDQVFLAVRFGLPPGALFPGSPAIPGDPATADKFELKHKSIAYTTLGATYDPGTWFVTGELGRISEAGFSIEANEGYITGGIRVKQFTPYLTYAVFKHGDTPPTTSPLVQALMDGSLATDQKSVSAGVRWDFMKGFALKGQIDHIMNDEGSDGLLNNTQPGFVAGKDYNVFSVAIDFVY